MNKIFPIACIFLFGCTDLSRDNPLDPKNPNAEADQIAVVQNFVVNNTKNTVAPPYVNYSQDALYDLKLRYADKMLILEYHMAPTDTAFRDSFATADNEFRYTTEYHGSTPRGFPHAFFNGRQTNICSNSLTM